MTSVTPTPAVNGRHQEWLQLMELAAREVVELMLGCKLTEAEGPAEAQLNITSMVGLAGKLCGVFSVRCGTRASVLMASKMLGIPEDKVGAETVDAVGEICNMVAGNFKNKIPGLSDGCMLSPPTVIVGNDYHTYTPVNSPALELNLLFESIPIVISLHLSSDT